MHRTAPSIASAVVLALALIVLGQPGGAAVLQEDAAAPRIDPWSCIATADELDDLDAKIKKIETASSEHGTSIVEIEVRNRGDRWAEPLTFLLQPRDKDAAPIAAARVEAPRFGRVGRLIQPNRRDRFRILVDATEKELDRADVRVTSASAWDEDSPALEIDFDDGDLRIGKPRTEREQYSVKTSVELENESAWPVDVLVEADHRDGKGGTTQYLVRLGPGETRVETFDTIPKALVGGVRPDIWQAELSRVSIVDWSAIVDDGSSVARRMVRRAWERWWSVDPAHFPLSVEFHADLDLRGRFGGNGQRFDTVEDFRAVATVELDGETRIADENGSKLPGSVESAVERSIRDAAVQLTRADFDTAAQSWRISLIEHTQPVGRDEVPGRTVVRLEGASALVGYNDAALVLEDDRIAMLLPPGTNSFMQDRATIWRSEEVDGRWRVLGTEVDHGQQGLVTKGFVWGESDAIGPGLESVTHDEESALVDAPEKVELKFERWRPSTLLVPRPAPPTGPLADELRAAWQAHYRFPDFDATVHGRFVATNPGTDGVWIGHTRVTGGFSLAGVLPHFWRLCDTVVEDEGLSTDDRAILAGAFDDRLLMWSGRDPVRWGPFDEVFAGTKLRRGEDGWIEVSDSVSFAQVRVIDGRVVAWRTIGGIFTAIEWVDHDGILLPAMIGRTGNGTAQLDWTEVAEGWWFPQRIHLETYFGADWGPETLELEVEGVRDPE